MSLFQWGDFTLHSGQKSWWRIDCDALTDSEIELLAKLIVERDGKPFGRAMAPKSHRGSSVPKLATALDYYASRTPSDGIIIVDDVLTTGASMQEVWEKAKSGPNVRGFVIFARGPCPYWVTPLFQVMGGATYSLGLQERQIEEDELKKENSHSSS